MNLKQRKSFVAGAGGIFSNAVIWFVLLHSSPSCLKQLYSRQNRSISSPTKEQTHTKQAVIPEFILNQITSAHFVVLNDIIENLEMGQEPPISAYRAGWLRTTTILLNADELWLIARLRQRFYRCV